MLSGLYRCKRKNKKIKISVDNYPCHMVIYTRDKDSCQNANENCQYVKENCQLSYVSGCTTKIFKNSVFYIEGGMASATL